MPLGAGGGGVADLVEGPGEELCYLVGNWRIFQRMDKHRYSTDDLVTTWVACAEARRLGYADTGTGAGAGAGTGTVAGTGITGTTATTTATVGTTAGTGAQAGTGTGAQAGTGTTAGTGAQAGAGALMLDVGCGIGSVLLCSAWQLPGAVCVGMEAQVRGYYYYY
jgi:hypothetical protein